MKLINFKEYADEHFCKKCLIRAKQLAFKELNDNYCEVIIIPDGECNENT